MTIKSEENHDDELNNQIEALTISKITASIILYPKNSKSYRLQLGDHNGSGVFFNPNGDHTRFGLMDGTNGSLYIAETPRTSMKEVFQEIPAIEVTDLDKYHMATLITEKDLQIVDLSRLAPKIPAKTHDVTSSNYKITQTIAKKISPHADGLRYISNVTLEPCFVLWNKDPLGKGVIRTKELTPLSMFEYNGELAEDILVNDLDIPVM
ncbi:RES domain-containing protein [Photobacterium carnosum]|uniref:RES domain-containing protein n=3 Tax=Photobacterium iliopiscarium TaxID=56192 RepID=A0ABX5GM41_9GAMM|nr:MULTISPECIES: RES family NAD+ phosphorylase [Photobacterium]MCD9550760.1 RES domain-containing protein [Photobacterium carnosum]MCF2307815.1 RES domain-containing protein [Photobacterium carnosum]PSW90488.1 RES domain-containing protein [Photobacterium iliopiscarium]